MKLNGYIDRIGINLILGPDSYCSELNNLTLDFTRDSASDWIEGGQSKIANIQYLGNKL